MLYVWFFLGCANVEYTDNMQSSLHRVGLPPNGRGQEITKERYTIPYFVSMDPDAMIECLPAFVGPEQPAKYKPVLLKDYLMAKALGEDI